MIEELIQFTKFNKCAISVDYNQFSHETAVIVTKRDSQEYKWREMLILSSGKINTLKNQKMLTTHLNEQIRQMVQRCNSQIKLNNQRRKNNNESI